MSKNIRDVLRNAGNQLKGWICPKCGRANAPHVSTCPCYKEAKKWPDPWPWPKHPWKPYYEPPYTWWVYNGPAPIVMF